MKQIKENAGWYASSFSAALSSSVMCDERKKEKAMQERRQALNDMLGIPDLNKAETEKLMKAHLYRLDDEPSPVEVATEDPNKKKPRRGRAGRVQIQKTTRKAKPVKKAATQKDLFYY